MMFRVFLAVLLLTSGAWAATDLPEFAYDQRLSSQIPLTAVFKDEQGKIMTVREAVRQRPTILALGYFHCPNLCGLVRDDLMNALSHVGADQNYNLIALSIDPSETPADAKAAKTVDVARLEGPARTAGWHYLTGSAPDIQTVADAVGFRFRFDAQDKQFLHPAGLVFLTGAGSVSSYILGLGYQPGDVSLAITRASNGITARALPILLLCFHYDQATGRYTLSIMRVLQLGAVITVLVIAGTMILAFRRERRVQ